MSICEDGDSATAPSYTDVFESQFPYYISIGMTEEQYWDKDCCLVKFYREADELKRERINQEAWLQGMYFYDALARISPILQAFAEKGTRAKPYVERAYPINKKKNKDIQTDEEKKKHLEGLQYMKSFMVANNKKNKDGR